MEEAAGEDEVGFWVLAEICSSDGVAKDWIWASTEKSSWRRYGLDRLHVQFPLVIKSLNLSFNMEPQPLDSRLYQYS
ncbi:hypothetical protein L3X38_034314 [Prunus dulcis]|uniref:Uncharacterized protein n=1 Tax=Prunus dulcis TaxID=3755 RepID=A0AAD4YXS3_PRUDU|nr:hypothetical protein L3X38_034314 [Prunus dulcis]